MKIICDYAWPSSVYSYKKKILRFFLNHNFLHNYKPWCNRMLKNLYFFFTLHFDESNCKLSTWKKLDPLIIPDFVALWRLTSPLVKFICKLQRVFACVSLWACTWDEIGQSWFLAVFTISDLITEPATI